MAANLFTQVFSTDLQKQLFPTNSFMAEGKDDSAFVNDLQVNLPIAGNVAGLEVNRTQFPAPVSRRNDSVMQYQMKELSSNPVHIQYSEELLVNYNKRASIVEEVASTMNTRLAQEFAFAWARGGDSENGFSQKPEILRTTGASRIGGSKGATGNRKAITLNDIIKVGTVFNKQDLGYGNRVALITPSMLEDLMLIEQFNNSDYNNRQVLATGYSESFNWMGIKWFVRSSANTFSNAGTPALKAVGANTAASDNEGALFFHNQMVRKAKGSVKAFMNKDDAEYYGDVISSLCRFGAIGGRQDGKGVVNLVEAAGA